MTQSQLHKTLTDRVRKFGISEVARDAKMGKSTLHKWLNNDIDQTTFATAVRLAKGLGIRIDFELIDTVAGTKISYGEPKTRKEAQR